MTYTLTMAAIIAVIAVIIRLQSQAERKKEEAFRARMRTYIEEERMEK